MSEKQLTGTKTHQGDVAENPAAQNATDALVGGGKGWLGGPQNGNEIPGNGGNGGNGGEKTEGAYQTAAHSTGFADPKQK
jgi:hypothetical protein